MAKIWLLYFVILILSPQLTIIMATNKLDVMQKTDFKQHPYVIQMQCEPIYNSFISCLGILVTADWVLLTGKCTENLDSCKRRHDAKLHFIAGTFARFSDSPFTGQMRTDVEIVTPQSGKLFLFKLNKPFDLTETVNIAKFAPTKDFARSPKCGQIQLLDESNQTLVYVLKNTTNEQCTCDQSYICCGIIDEDVDILTKAEQGICYGKLGSPVLCDGYVVALKSENPEDTLCYARDNYCNKFTVVEYYYTDIEEVTGRKMPFKRNESDRILGRHGFVITRFKSGQTSIRSDTCVFSVIISLMCLNILNLF